MSTKKIIKEAMEKNPTGLKEALSEELKNRIAAVLEMRGVLDESFGVFAKGERVGLDDLKISDDGQKFLGSKKAGTIGTKPIKTFGSKEEANRFAKDMRRRLSPAEKKYYGLNYVVKPIKEDLEDTDYSLEEAFNLEVGTKVKMKKGSEFIYGKVSGKETVMGKPGVEVKWDNGTKGRFSNSSFSSASMDKKADYIVESASK